MHAFLNSISKADGERDEGGWCLRDEVLVEDAEPPERPIVKTDVTLQVTLSRECTDQHYDFG